MELTDRNATEQAAPGESETIIEAIGLRKKYPDTEALKGVSLEVRRGEVVCVIGPNGAGKTTLLYLLGGLIYASAGHVTVFGMHRWKKNFDIRKRSIVLPAQTVYGTSPTPYEYLRFLGQIYGLPWESFREKVQLRAKQMQYWPHVHKEWQKLSLGLQKKAGLIGAFLPELLLRILDEPFASGIDPLGVEVLYEWMSDARSRGETTVFSTQILEHAEQIADRLVLLHEGSIAAIGSTAEILEQAGVSPGEKRALARAYVALTTDAAKGKR